MAYTANVKRPQAGAGNQSGYQRTYDRLVEVIGYNLESKTVYVKDETEKKYAVSIDPEKYAATVNAIKAKNTQGAPAPYMGHEIDEKMKKAIPVGKKMILKNSKVIKKDNGEGYAQTLVSKINAVTVDAPNKTFSGIFTVSAKTNKDRNKVIGRVQNWKDQSIDINDEEKLQQLKKDIDEAASFSGKKIGEYNVTMPTMGVQFWALMETDRINPLDNKMVLEAVEGSIPFDWIIPENETGDKAKGHPLTGDEMLGMVEGFMDYISNHPNFKDKLDKMRIEISPYYSYPASENDKLKLTFGDPKKDQYAHKNPLYKLSHARSFVDMDQTEEIQGRNLAVRGIVQISDNKLERVDGKPVEIPSYWVSNLHVDHTTAPVRNLVRSSDGLKVELHENLKLRYVTNDNPNASANNSAPAQSQQSSASAPAASAPVAQPAAKVDSDEMDPFAGDDDIFGESTPAATTTDSAPVKSFKFGAGRK